MTGPSTAGTPPATTIPRAERLLAAGLAEVVFTFSFDSWGDAVRRGMHRPPDRLVQMLLDDEGVRRLLVANPYRSAPVRAARTAVRRHDPPFPTSDRHALVTPVRVRRADATDVPRLRTTYAAYDAALARAAQDLGMSAPAVITTHPFVAAFSPAPWAHKVLFYVRDDWSALPARRRWWPAYRAAFREVRRSGRPVVAVSQHLLDRLAPSGPSAVVPNGIEPAEWAWPPPPAPPWLAAIPGPRALYVGTVDSRIDVSGLLSLVARQPDLHVVLLGPQADRSHIAPLFGHPRISLHPWVDRASVVAAVRASELCLIAHRRTPLTEAMSPLKLYEYLAGGKPVLSIDLAPVRGISDRVLLTDSVADFADVLDDALALGDAPEASRLGFVAANAWASRHRAILDLALA